MTIVSISLNKKLINDMDSIIEESGFSGRSEILRAGLRMLIEDKKQKENLKGIVDGILLIMYYDKHSPEVSKIRHEYQEVVKTQVHNHIANGKCLEIFILKGAGKKVSKLYENFQTNRKIDYTKLIVS